jgi:hypothetical protein
MTTILRAFLNQCVPCGPIHYKSSILLTTRMSVHCDNVDGAATWVAARVLNAGDGSAFVSFDDRSLSSDCEIIGSVGNVPTHALQ